MRVKRYSFPQEMHGKAPASLQMYFNAVGAADDKGITVRPIDPVSTNISTSGSATLNPPTAVTQTTTETTGATNVGAGVSSPQSTTSTNPLVSPTTTLSTAPAVPVPTINAVPLIQNIIQPVVPGITSRELTTPVITASGGGGGGFGMPSEEEKPVAAPVKKKTVFPWLLIAAGIYMIVEKPLK